MAYSSSEIKQVEYLITLEDGTNRLILSREDGNFVEIDVSGGGTVGPQGPTGPTGQTGAKGDQGPGPLVQIGSLSSTGLTGAWSFA